MNRVLHGIATEVKQLAPDPVLFENVPERFEAGRYHSWIVEQAGLPACFEVTSRDDQGMIMSMKHREYDVRGVQFHPESVLTPEGEKIIENWLRCFHGSPDAGALEPNQ